MKNDCGKKGYLLGFKCFIIYYVVVFGLSFSLIYGHLFGLFRLEAHGTETRIRARAHNVKLLAQYITFT